MSLKLDQIKMIEATCLSFSVYNDPQTEIFGGFAFEFTTQTKADAENKLIFVQLKIEINAQFLTNLEGGEIESPTVEGETKEYPDKNIFKAGEFEFGFTYRIENLDELIEIVDDHRVLEKTLHISLLGIAFSTARGIIITRAANTILEDAYLPIVNPAHLLDPEFEII